jgi:hypothetical protein
MTTYFRFLLLSIPEKKQCLEEKGILLLQCSNEKGEFSLYALADFFVELQTDKQQDILHILAFKNPQLLEDYVRHIELNTLIAQQNN